MLDNPEVTRALLPHISSTMKNVLSQCSAVMTSTNKVTGPPQIGPNLHKIGPTAELELQPMKKAPKRKAGAVLFQNPSAEQKRQLHDKLLSADKPSEMESSGKDYLTPQTPH